MPGDKDPSQAISVCPYCNAAVSQNATTCQSCKKSIIPEQGRPYEHRVLKNKEKLVEFEPIPEFINKTKAASFNQKEAKNKKNKIKKVRDVYISEDFNQCAKAKIKKKDKKIDE